LDSKEYFEALSRGFESANGVASAARAKGLDPQTFVEIRPAPDLASRVEGIIGIEGLAKLIHERAAGKTRQELAFIMAKEICTSSAFEMEQTKRLTLAVRVGLSILTEGILVAPTEGIQGVKINKNSDGTDYASVLFAGPIRGAGGTGAALSVALADYSRKILGIGQYRATPSEIERYLEEIMIYHSRIARLQYLPPEKDTRHILENCPVCIDGVPTETMEVAIHRNIKRLNAQGKEEFITNKIRGGIGLVLCEGIAQKAKSVLKYAKGAGLEWEWLNGIIKISKTVEREMKDVAAASVFLSELVAGRPILAYPEHAGSFRLRYGRSRITGIAAKGFSPATMILLEEFIATGTQIKIEKPGKGCVAMPVDSIEGPFVKLKSGYAMRVNTAAKAREVMNQIDKILAVGDILVTYGDFRKTNTPLNPTSYVEEYWSAQLGKAGCTGIPERPTFREAFELSKNYEVPMHPQYIYEYQDLTVAELCELADALCCAALNYGEDKGAFGLVSLTIPEEKSRIVRGSIERLCVPHFDDGSTIRISGENAQSLLFSLGLWEKGNFSLAVEKRAAGEDPIAALEALSPFRIMRRATRIGGRIGRPEKARERLMKPAPHVIFPIGEYGGKERDLHRAYSSSARAFGAPGVEVEIARYRCKEGGELLPSFYCQTHSARAEIERRCRNCDRVVAEESCIACGGEATGWSRRIISIVEVMDSALKSLGMQVAPKSIKGVKGVINYSHVVEPLAKGILRSANNVHIFKDGTCRFDATDVPMTHFYPAEIGVDVKTLVKMGYEKDASGAPLEREDQLVEMRHQDVIMNRRGAEFFLHVAHFVDELLVKLYGLEPFYKANDINDLLGHHVITLSPHTSAGVLGRIIGFTNSNVGFAHPYTISARRRNCDGDEDTTMLLLDALINFSRSYLPTTVGGTMDAPIIMTLHIHPEEVDDEVHAMEICSGFGLDFYDKTLTYPSPGEVKPEMVADRLGGEGAFSGLGFTHESSISAIADAPKGSMYTRLKNMNDKVKIQFSLMDKLYSIDKRDSARRLIISHFIPDLMGNLHSFSKQTLRCIACNAKYRRVPLTGKCTKCRGKLVLTISKGGIEKYMEMAQKLAERYDLDVYIRQCLSLIKGEIDGVFTGEVIENDTDTQQINLARFMK
jgi:DNA polymerase II large subunit